MARKKKIAAEVAKKVIGGKSSRGRKRIRGRPSKEVKEVMEKEGVGRREAEEIIAARKKDKAKAKLAKPLTRAEKLKETQRRRELTPEQRFTETTVRKPRRKENRTFRYVDGKKRSKAEQRELANLLKDQKKDWVSDTDTTGGSKMTRIKTGPESVPFAQRVEQGPPSSKIPPPLRSEQSPAQVRRRVMQGLQGITHKGETKDIGQFTDTAEGVAEKMGIGGKGGITNDHIADVMEMVERGDLTLKKKGGSIKSKKTKRKSASKPRGVGKAMRGWGATMKRRT